MNPASPCSIDSAFRSTVWRVSPWSPHRYESLRKVRRSKRNGNIRYTRYSFCLRCNSSTLSRDETAISQDLMLGTKVPWLGAVVSNVLEVRFSPAKIFGFGWWRLRPNRTSRTLLVSGQVLHLRSLQIGIHAWVGDRPCLFIHRSSIRP